MVEPSSLVQYLAPPVAFLGTLVNDDELADVVFTIENERVYAHRLILMKRSEYFRAMFRSGMRETAQDVVPISGTRKGVFLLLLEYFYTGSVHVAVNHAIELYSLADMYGIGKRLQSTCCESIQRNLTPDQVGTLLQKAFDCKCEQLEEACLKYFLKNYKLVCKTDSIEKITSLELCHRIMNKSWRAFTRDDSHRLKTRTVRLCCKRFRWSQKQAEPTVP